MTEGKEIRVGVIGLGFMGRTHIEAYRGAAAAGHSNRLAAVCDVDVERLRGRIGPEGNFEEGQQAGLLFDPAELRTCTTPEELLAGDDVDLVSICTHTQTHVDVAIQALRAGKHVLVEKPVATSIAEVERLLAAAREAETLCMPAMCMRFWPGWSWLKENIDSGEYGRVRSAFFRRLASRPDWSPAFYEDVGKTGGALFDLHVHDSDFVRHCFGAPTAVSTAGNVHHLTTLYRYPDGPDHVAAEGGWDHSSGFGFRMRYTVVFEGATADFDLDREAPLVLCRAGTSEPVELPNGDGYDGEVRHLLGTVARGSRNLAATIEEAVGLTRMIEAEEQSIRTGRTVSIE
jgi:predicted dehydrogenase